MALHIADPEVSKLVAELSARQHQTKTEYLRNLLRREMERQRLREQAKRFEKVATEIIASARAERLPPVSKQEIDQLWGQ